MPANHQLFGTTSDYSPWSFTGLPADQRPWTLGASCPESTWFLTEHWHCFCSLRKTESYDFRDGATPVRRCDGREIAIRRMEVE